MPGHDQNINMKKNQPACNVSWDSFRDNALGAAS